MLTDALSIRNIEQEPLEKLRKALGLRGVRTLSHIILENVNRVATPALRIDDDYACLRAAQGQNRLELLRTIYCWLIAGILSAQVASAALSPSNAPTPAVVSTSAPLTNAATISLSNITTTLQTNSPVASQPTTTPERGWWSPERIPAVYGAVAGAAIAFIGNWLTNRHNAKLKKIELAHQAEQKEKERQHALKTDVYLPLCEAVADAVGFIARTSNIPFEQLYALETPATRLSRQMARINIIAPRDLFEPLNVGLNKLMKCFMTLVSERMLIESVSTNIKVTNSSIERIQSEQKDLTRRLESAEGALKMDLLKRANSLGEEFDQLLRRFKELSGKKTEMEFDLQAKTRESLKPIRQHAFETLVAIRRDLNLPIDEVWLKEFLKKQSEEMDADLKSFQEQTRTHVRELFTAGEKLKG
jgi:hypothetical protein